MKNVFKKQTNITTPEVQKLLLKRGFSQVKDADFFRAIFKEKQRRLNQCSDVKYKDGRKKSREEFKCDVLAEEFMEVGASDADERGGQALQDQTRRLNELRQLTGQGDIVSTGPKRNKPWNELSSRT